MSDNIDLQITIVGKANSGKTTVAEILERALKDVGMKVTVQDVDFEPYPSPIDLLKRELALAGRKVNIKVIQAIKETYTK